MNVSYYRLVLGLFILALVVVPSNSIAGATLRGVLAQNREKMVDLTREELLDVQDIYGWTNQEVEQAVIDYRGYLYGKDMAFLDSVEASMSVEPQQSGGTCSFLSSVDMPVTSVDSNSVSDSDGFIGLESDELYEPQAIRRKKLSWFYAVYAGMCTIEYYNALYQCRQKCDGVCDKNCYSACASDAYSEWLRCISFR